MSEKIVIARQFANAGANYVQQNQIQAMARQGSSVEEIAIALNIDPNCVKSFYDLAMGEAAPVEATPVEATPVEDGQEQEQEQDWT